MASQTAGRQKAALTILNDADIRKQIKSNELCGAYLFFGDEDYLKNHIAKSIHDAVLTDPVFSVFNEVTIEYADYSHFALENSLMALPMGMTGEEKKIITVHGFTFNSQKPSFIDEFISTVSLIEQLSHNILVIIVPAGELDEGKPPKNPSSLLKKLGQHMNLVHFPEQTPARLAAWANRHFEHFGIKITHDLCDYLITRCGKSMFTLSSEIEKVSYYLLYNKRDTVCREDIDLVTCAELDCDTFDLTNAVISGDRVKAMSVLEVLKFRRTDPVKVLGEISATLYTMARVAAEMKLGANSAEISKRLGIHEYRVGIFMHALSTTDPHSARDGRRRLFDAINLCARADMELKRNGKGFEPIEKFLCSM